MASSRQRFRLEDFGVRLPNTTGLGDLATDNPLVAQILGLTDRDVPDEAPTVIDTPLLTSPGGGPSGGGSETVATPRGKGGGPSDEAGSTPAIQREPEATEVAQPDGAPDLFSKAKSIIPQGLTEDEIQRIQELEGFQSAFNRLGSVKGGIGKGVAGIGSLFFLNKAKRTRNELLALRKKQAVRSNFVKNKRQIFQLQGEEAETARKIEVIEDERAENAMRSIKNSVLLNEPINPKNAEAANLRGSMVNGRWVGPRLSDITNIDPRVVGMGGSAAFNAMQEPVSDRAGVNEKSLDFLAGLEEEVRDYDKSIETYNRRTKRADAKTRSKALSTVEKGLARIFSERKAIVGAQRRIEKFPGMASEAEKTQIALAQNVMFTQGFLVETAVNSGDIPGFPPGSVTASGLSTMDSAEAARFIPNFLKAVGEAKLKVDNEAKRAFDSSISRKDNKKKTRVADDDDTNKKNKTEAGEKAEFEALKKKKAGGK